MTTSIGQVKGDGKPTCFSSIADTGIPDLQKWCHQLTIASRERAARAFMTHLKAFAVSINSYVQGIGDITAIDREALRTKWESQGFDQANEYGVNPLGDPFLDGILGGLGGDLGAGLYAINKPALKVDPHEQLTGITPRLCTVRIHQIPHLPSNIPLQDFAKVVDKCVQDLQQNFKDGLEDKCRVGAANVGLQTPPYLFMLIAKPFRLQTLQSLPLMNLRPLCTGLPIERVSNVATKCFISSTHQHIFSTPSSRFLAS